MRQWIRSALVQIMACRLLGAKPLYKPMLGYCQLDFKLNEIAIKIQNLSFTKMHLKTTAILSRGGWANIYSQRHRNSVVLHNTDICQLGNATDDPEETLMQRSTNCKLGKQTWYADIYTVWYSPWGQISISFGVAQTTVSDGETFYMKIFITMFIKLIILEW